ncbi:hypothetical protein [Sinomonas atrocyanea]
MAGPRAIVGALAAVLFLTSCSSGTGEQLGSALEDAAAATASVDLSLAQVQEGRSTRAATMTLGQNMRDKVIEARDQASRVNADKPRERQERADALKALDAILAETLAAKDAVADGDRTAMGTIRPNLQQLTRDARAEAADLKGGKG